MKPNSAHTSRWRIGEVIFGFPFFASLALHFIWPFSFPPGIPRQVLIPTGVLLGVAGMGLLALARREFSRYGQPTDPGQPTSRVVTTGVFALSRNPLYLGAGIFLLGIAFAFNLPWSVVTLLPSMILCHYLLILPEEQYLTGKFGSEYEIYAASVHRWFGRKKPAENRLRNRP
jgi:protein-S-isoprenylcysteine O-methyltransferase Ste14